MAEKSEKMHWTYWLHLAIGLGFMLGFPMLDPIEPITEIGMTVLGVFIGMVYLWSALDSIWPSLLGLLLVAMSGYVTGAEGYAAVKNLFLNSFGAETVIVLILGMVLFSAVQYVGCTKYLARVFLSIKLLEGRPYVFMFVFFMCAVFVSGLASPIASLLILWPLATEICDGFGYKKGDKTFYIMVCGVYLGTTLGQPMIPFKGAPYIVVSAFEKVSGLTVNFASYIAYNIIMCIILLILFLAWIRLVVRPDVEAMKKITVAELTKEKLPPINAQQIAYFAMIGLYIVALLAPNILPKTIPFVALLSKFGVLGISIIFVVVLMIVPYKGKPMLDFKAVAKQYFHWDIYFLVAAALYVCNAMTSEITGIKPFLVQVLQPLLGGKPEIVFIFLILAFAIITTNFANNAGMAVVLMPVIMAFAEFYPGIDLVVLAMTVCMIVFVALLTPAASPFCGMLHARKDLVSFNEIVSLFLPMAVIALITYTFIGFQIAKFLF